MSRRLVPPLDLGWLLLESRDTPNHVGGLMIFELPPGAPPSYMRDLTTHLRSVQSLTSPWNLHLAAGAVARHLPLLENEGQPDLEYHVRRLALPQPGGERELGELVSRLHANSLDLRRPMWECYVIEGLEENRFALFLKIHHVLLDGVAGMRIISQALSPDPTVIGSPPWGHVSKASKKHKNPSPDSTPESSETKSQQRLPRAALVNRRGLLLKSIRNLYPLILPRSQRVANLVSAFAAPHTVLNGRITGQRRVSTQCVPLARLKRIADQAEVSVNDVVLAFCGGGLRRLLAEAGELPNKATTACIPINVRPAGEISVGTAISFGFADLATDEADPLERLKRVHASTAALKKHISALPRTTVGAFTMAVMGPYLLQQLTGLGGRTRPMFNVTISNVPGPQQELYLFGAKMRALYPASVLYHGQALNITCVRYHDNLNFGFTAWRDALPHVQRIAVYCGEALDELEAALGIGKTC